MIIGLFTRFPASYSLQACCKGDSQIHRQSLLLWQERGVKRKVYQIATGPSLSLLWATVRMKIRVPARPRLSHCFIWLARWERIIARQLLRLSQKLLLLDIRNIRCRLCSRCAPIIGFMRCTDSSCVQLARRSMFRTFSRFYNSILLHTLSWPTFVQSSCKALPASWGCWS
jgi:hypothetical protein